LTRFPRPRDGHIALLKAALATSYGTVGNRFIAHSAHGDQRFGSIISYPILSFLFLTHYLIL